MPSASRRQSSASIRSGIGLYLRADAARLLHLSPGTLNRWVKGYTYRPTKEGQPARRAKRLGPIVSVDLPEIDNSVALSFHELMELRVVKAIVDRGVSLRHVRAAAAVASLTFRTPHPFASRRVFTDGKNIFSSVAEEHLVKWTEGEIGQLIAGQLFTHFLDEIEFDERTALAQRWWPRGRNYPVVLDPTVRFGSPVVQGTGVKTAVIASMARASSVQEAASAFEIDVEAARAAVEFENALAAS